MKTNPCYGCPDRTVEPNCHATCIRYLEWVDENEKIKEERRKDFDYYEYRDDVMKKKGKTFEK